MPLGIWVKSSRPFVFCVAKSNGAWSVATVSINPARRASHQTANIAQRAHQDGHLLLQHLHLHLRQADTEQSLRVLDLLPLLL